MTSVGEPQPMRAIGPNTWRPAAGGNTVASVATSCWAWPTGSDGKSTESSAPDLSPARSGSIATVRLIPSRPPTPLSVKPSPSWHRRELGRDDDQEGVAGDAAGQPVVNSPTALSAMPENESWSAPAYCWRSGS